MAVFAINEVLFMSGKLPTYLKTYRKQSGMSQQDLAFLFGCQENGTVSRIERERREPNLDTVFASEYIFGVAGQELFPRKFDRVARRVQPRIRNLLEIEKAKQAPNPRKVRHLETLLRHDSTEPHVNNVWQNSTEDHPLS